MLETIIVHKLDESFITDKVACEVCGSENEPHYMVEEVRLFLCEPCLLRMSQAFYNQEKN